MKTMMITLTALAALASSPDLSAQAIIVSQPATILQGNGLHHGVTSSRHSSFHAGFGGAFGGGFGASFGASSCSSRSSLGGYGSHLAPVQTRLVQPVVVQPVVVAQPVLVQPLVVQPRLGQQVLVQQVPSTLVVGQQQFVPVAGQQIANVNTAPQRAVRRLDQVNRNRPSNAGRQRRRR